MTSHDVVAKLRRIFGTRKVGHAGTLDPMATGVLVIGIERATKLLGHLSLDTKSYLAPVVLGAATVTDDAEGEVIARTPANGVTDEAIAAGIAALTGDIRQVPSAVSAVKVDGKRSYARVRDGEQVELPPRAVTVSRFALLASRREAATIELDVLVDCSSGTYIRALARDLGVALGVGGHLGALRRTTVGPFGLAAARTLDQLADAPSVSLDLDAAVRTAFPVAQVSESAARAIRYGQRTPATGIDGTYGVFDPDGVAVALAADRGNTLKTLIVLDPA
jgi:tRNA pseudouridine55 synthase